MADSIAALATPAAPSAIALIRCSGPLCATVIAPPLTPRKATLYPYRNQAGVLLDQTLVTYFSAGRSYTGEDTLEIACHGNPFIAQKILADLLARGFRLAEPGEFTRRAFLNGKLDLTQAEAVREIIAAHSDRALAAAHRQLAGQLGSSIRGFADTLLSVIAQVEAYIDFPDEDLPPESPITPTLTALIAQLSALQRTQRAHTLVHEGARVALVGLPNAGKSSLLNALLGHDRALVSPEPGTTRDYLSASLSIGGHAVQLIDTAGLNATPTTIEALGIAKTRDQLATADLILWLVDVTQAAHLPEVLDPARTLLVLNKSDLATPTLLATRQAELTALLGHPPLACVSLSALTGLGLDGLRATISQTLAAQLPTADGLMVSARHAEALGEVLTQLNTALSGLKNNLTPELIAHHLHAALGALGTILGKFDNEQILDKLFGQFCIGK